MDKINTSYKENIEEIKKAFHQNKEFPSVTLTQFFNEKFFKEMERKVKGLKFIREAKIGQLSYAKAKASPLHLLNNKEFVEFINTILNTEGKQVRGETYRCSWQDHSLIKKEKASIDVILDFTTEWKEEYGGAIVYKKENGDFVKVEAVPNSITIIKRKASTSRYLQYINNLSKGKKRHFILAAIY